MSVSLADMFSFFYGGGRGSTEIYQAIVMATESGDKAAIIEYEAHLSEEGKKEIVQKDAYWVVLRAIIYGQTEILRHLLSHLNPEEKKEAVQSFSYNITYIAVRYGHLEALQYLFSHLNVGERSEAIQIYGNRLVQTAFRYNHIDIVKHLMQYPCALHYSEQHHREYGDVVSPYVMTQLEHLFERKAAYETANPDGVFDIEGDKVERTFLLLRYLIRSNQTDDVPYIETLMTIPALHAVLHRGYIDREAAATGPAFAGLAETDEAENQLLRIAQDVGNVSAARVLLGIEAIRIRAEAADYYRGTTASSELNLADIARDRESSMRALGPAQKRMADAIQAKYGDTMRALGGVEAVFERFKKELVALYEENPAKVTLGGEELSLPVSYVALQELKAEKSLTDEAYQAVLEAYHAHPVHTAFRYLSNPNPWMDAHAFFVYVSEDGYQRWSTFEEYIPTIAYFYLAAGDEEIPSVDGSAVSDRVNLFIQQVALIGRAHNWNQSDDKGCYYDDIRQGDKPSCFSGVPRRLYQSVIGHPLMTVLTQEIIKQAVHEFKLDYFKQAFASLSVSDQERVFADYSTVVVEYGETSELLQGLNIPEENIGAFKHSLREKYGEQFDASLSAVVAKLFKLDEGESHFSNFYEPDKMKRVLEAAASAAKEAALEIRAALLALIKEETPSYRSPAFFASSAGSGYQALVEYLEGGRDELTEEHDIPERLKEPMNQFAKRHGYEGIHDLIEALKPDAPSQTAAFG